MTEYVEIDAQELNDYISSLEDENKALKAQVVMNKLFCDLKTDEEKSAFFLSGRGYETGIIAVAIQNDVAMAYHRCAEYKKELAALQAECEKYANQLRQQAMS